MYLVNHFNKLLNDERKKKPRQEDSKFQGSLGYIVKFKARLGKTCLKINK